LVEPNQTKKYPKTINQDLVFQDKKGVANSGYCSRWFFSWVSPLIKIAKDGRKLNVEMYG
jgi:hypothetical protein